MKLKQRRKMPVGLEEDDAIAIRKDRGVILHPVGLRVASIHLARQQKDFQPLKRPTLRYLQQSPYLANESYQSTSKNPANILAPLLNMKLSALASTSLDLFGNMACWNPSNH